MNVFCVTHCRTRFVSFPFWAHSLFDKLAANPQAGQAQEIVCLFILSTDRRFIYANRNWRAQRPRWRTFPRDASPSDDVRGLISVARTYHSQPWDGFGVIILFVSDYVNKFCRLGFAVNELEWNQCRMCRFFLSLPLFSRQIDARNEGSDVCCNFVLSGGKIVHCIVFIRSPTFDFQLYSRSEP